MKIGFLYYDGFAEFEIALACLLLHTEELIFIGVEKKIYQSEEKQKFVIDTILSEIDINEFDALIIPGGDPSYLYSNDVVSKKLHEFANSGKIVAGICGGAVLMAQKGLLNGKRATGNTSGIFEKDNDYIHFTKSTVVNEFVVVDGNIITGQGQAYAEFAVEICRKLGMLKTQKEYEDELKWLKNIRQ
jgi:4-methyl-5(b-hydroxyethyl)-thiazole monophosphate biosynthesis